MTHDDREAIHPPIGRLAKDDPIRQLMKGMDQLVAEGIINTAHNVRSNMEEKDVLENSDHRVLSASCSTYIYGAMYVLIELYRDLGWNEKEATEKALVYLNTAGAVVAKYRFPPEKEH